MTTTAAAEPPALLDHVDEALVRPDEDLLDAARAADAAALDELCRRHHPRALTLARGHATHDYPAQDLAADAMLRMLTALSRGHGPHTSVPAYLAATIRNLAISAARRRAHSAYPQPTSPELLHEVHAAPEHRTDPERAALEAETRAELTAAIARLQPGAQQILNLLHVEYLTVAQCAQLLGTSPDAVRSMSYRARRALRWQYQAL